MLIYNLVIARMKYPRTIARHSQISWPKKLTVFTNLNVKRMSFFLSHFSLHLLLFLLLFCISFLPIKLIYKSLADISTGLEIATPL